MLEILLAEEWSYHHIILMVQNEHQTIDYKSVKKHINGKLFTIAGRDSFEKWIKYENEIEAFDGVIVVPRHIGETNSNKPLLLSSKHTSILAIENTLYTCSSTDARSNINDEFLLKNFLSLNIINYIKQNNLYNIK
jgi:nicotinic acid mononucleotide adenylyltransferase